MKNGRYYGLAAVAVAAAIGLASVAEAQNPPPVVAQRQEMMKGNGAAARVLTPIARGEQPWNQQAVVTALTTLRDSAGRIPGMFPAGTGPDRVPQTNALPPVFTQSADFAAKAKTMGDAASNLLALAQANNEAGFKAAFATLGQSCGGCHTPYRKPQQ